MIEFSTLRDEFKRYFASSHDEAEISCDDRNCWVNATVKPLKNPCVHYELIRRGADYFVELHVEQKLSPELRQRLLDAASLLRRNYAYFTYYTNQYLQKRTPVQNTEELKLDLDDLVAIVEKIYGGARLLYGEKSTDCTKDSNSLLLNGYEEISLADVAERLRNDYGKRFVIPGVQRGRVWNAARMSALWDSLMRGFPVGSFSVRIAGSDGDEMELLDGQQRANAIALAFRKFPPNPDFVDEQEAREADVCPRIIANETPILWLDIDGADAIAGTEFKYAFFVTTASQPWGYYFSGDETRNSLLRTFEKRDATQRLEKLELTFSGNASGKPYPCELRPYCAKCPVPFGLLREFVWERDLKDSFKGSDFVDWINSLKRSEKGVERPTGCWNWFEEYKNKISAVEIEKDLVDAIQNLKSIKIMCTDATNVGADDIALYFTRIGKGGVRPSDEELAFSTLKSKLGSELGKKFRNTIYAKANQGMASAARLAHLAIRCIKSEKTGFYAGDVLSAAMEIAASTEKQEEFRSFMDKFNELIEYVNGKVLELAKVPKPDGEAMKGFSNWHLSRFCSVSNGDAYLFLLLEARDYDRTKEAAALQRAAVELISLGGYKLDRCFRYIREREESDYASRIRLGISRALRDSHRGIVMLRFPETPKFFENEEDRVAFSRNIFKNGYGNSKAYSILLYACKGALPEYVANSAQWEEENCPWDYDHILPRSWVDKLGDVEGAECCREVVNSIGNLAPLPYSLNRKLSDDSRLPTYPYDENADRSEWASYQTSLRIELGTIGKEDKAKFGGSDEEARKQREGFCSRVKRRFANIYKVWYDGIGLKELLSFDDVVSLDESVVRAKFILGVFRKLRESKGDAKIDIYGLEIGGGGLEKSTEKHLSDILHYSWVSVEVVLDDCAVAFTLNLSGLDIEFGVRKKPEKQSTEEEVRKRIAEVLLKDEFDTSDNQYWYAYSGVFEHREINGSDALSVEEVSAEIQKLASAVGARSIQ